MEPQWNPTIEEQAFARIFRISQLQETTMIRFVMKDTIEEVCGPIAIPTAMTSTPEFLVRQKGARRQERPYCCVPKPARCVTRRIHAESSG